MASYTRIETSSGNGEDMKNLTNKCIHGVLNNVPCAKCEKMVSKVTDMQTRYYGIASKIATRCIHGKEFATPCKKCDYLIKNGVK